LYGLKEVK